MACRNKHDDEHDDDNQAPTWRYAFPPRRLPYLPVTRGWLAGRFQSIERHLSAIERAISTLGVKVSEATDLLDRINGRTNDIATIVRELRDAVANQPDASPDVLARLDAVADALDGIAADPTNPVPEPTPGESA